jgi:hypothetical protein
VIETSRRRFDSVLIAGVTVVPPPDVNPFFVASARAFVDAVLKSPGMCGTPARAAASAACCTWRLLFQMLPTSMTSARIAMNNVSDSVNTTRICPASRARRVTGSAPAS